MSDIFKKRRSTKNFKSDMIDDDIIKQIVEAGCHAPSGRNRQSPIIIVIKNKEIRDKLEKINAEILNSPESHPFYNAPVVLVVLADKDISTHVYDGSLTAANLMLKAEELEIGSCWIHRAKETFATSYGKDLLKSLNISKEYEGIANIVIGYKDYTPKPKPIKNDYVYYID